MVNADVLALGASPLDPAKSASSLHHHEAYVMIRLQIPDLLQKIGGRHSDQCFQYTKLRHLQSFSQLIMSMNRNSCHGMRGA